MANRESILPPYLVNTIREDIPTPWTDLARAIDSVFESRVDTPRDFLAKLRHIYLQNSTTSTKSTARGLISFDDYDKPEKSILVAAVNMLGQEFVDTSFINQDDFLRLYRNLATFWYEKGKFNFIDFIGFLLNAQLNMYHLWSGRDKYVNLQSGEISSPSKVIVGDATMRFDIALNSYTGSNQYIWACDNLGTEYGRELYIDSSGVLTAKWIGRYRNLLAGSQDFTNPAWVTNLLPPGASVTPNALLAPDATMTGDILTQTDGNPTVLYQDVTVPAGFDIYAASFYFQHVDTDYTTVEVKVGDEVQTVVIDWNLLSATATGLTVQNVDFTLDTGSWYRLGFLFYDLLGTSTTITVRVWAAGIGGAAGNVGAWGANLTRTDFVMPYSASYGTYTGTAALGSVTGARVGIQVEWIDANEDGNGEIKYYLASPVPTTDGLPLTYVLQNTYTHSGPLGVTDNTAASYKLKATGLWHKASLFKGAGRIPAYADPASDSLRLYSQHPEISTGSVITISKSPASASMPGGVSVGNYYAIQVGPEEFRLATSLANAEAGTYVNITSTGTARLTIASTKIVRPLVSEFQPRGMSVDPVIDAVLDKNLNKWTLPTGGYTATDSEYYPFREYGTLDVIGQPIWEGGNWFPTCHVRVSFDPSKFSGLNQDTLKAFFYSFANYDLVLESIDEEETIGIGAPAKQPAPIVGLWFYEDEEEWPTQINGPFDYKNILVGGIPTIYVV